MSCENNGLIDRLQRSEEKLENLGKKVEELEKKNEAVVMLINTISQIFMSLFDRMTSLLEQLPESIAKVAVEQLKKDLVETAKMLEKARKNSYVV